MRRARLISFQPNTSFYHDAPMAQKPRRKSIESRITAVERSLGSLRASDAAILAEVRHDFDRVESRLDQIYNHVDGFIKFHETLDIECQSPHRADETTQRARK